MITLHCKLEITREQKMLIGHALLFVLQGFGMRPDSQKRNRYQGDTHKSD